MTSARKIEFESDNGDENGNFFSVKLNDNESGEELFGFLSSTQKLFPRKQFSEDQKKADNIGFFLTEDHKQYFDDILQKFKNDYPDLVGDSTGFLARFPYTTRDNKSVLWVKVRITETEKGKKEKYETQFVLPKGSVTPAKKGPLPSGRVTVAMKMGIYLYPEGKIYGLFFKPSRIDYTL